MIKKKILDFFFILLCLECFTPVNFQLSIMTLTLPEGRLVALCMSDRLVVVWTYAHDPLRGV